MGIRSLQRFFRPPATVVAHEPDLHQVAIDTLVAKGTPFASRLAMEIERGRQPRIVGDADRRMETRAR